MLESKLENEVEWPWNRLTVVGYSAPAEEGLFSFLRRSVDWGTDLVAEGWSDVDHFSGSVEENCTLINSNLGC